MPEALTIVLLLMGFTATIPLVVEDIRDNRVIEASEAVAQLEYEVERKREDIRKFEQHGF